ncbi:MAG: DUF1549 domain-containing protein [Pirellulales bacterium]
MNRSAAAAIACRLLHDLVWAVVFTTVLYGSTARAGDLDPASLSRRIDERLELVDVPASRMANDSDFLRRVTLDLAGRIPTISEVHEYTSSASEHRRSELIQRLMQSGVYYKNMAAFWRRSWVPQADTREFSSVADGFELWLTERLRTRVRYDELVAEVLTLDHARPAARPAAAIGFYAANLSKPENLAASSTRAFLGINLDCAQCHDHPFSRWTREQFWQTAAFFAPPSPPESESVSRLPKVRVPDTDLEYEPRFLTRAQPQLPAQFDSVILRRSFVDWMKSDDERLMAKNAVNRLWAHFFGEAIIEPLDDLSRDDFQTGERAELLQELAQAFLRSDYDLDYLTAAIVGSQAYALASSPALPAHDADDSARAGTDQAPSSPRFRIRQATVRGLTGEQLYDSLRTAAGLPSERPATGGADRDGRREFAALFYVERTHQAERSISQSLALMNGAFVNRLTTADGNPTLASLLSSPFMTPDEQVDALYLAVLARRPSEGERFLVQRHFDDDADAGREQQLGNLFWVLVNSAEFSTNH